MTINTIDVFDSFTASATAGYYIITYTAGEGHNDITDAENLPIVMTIKDNAGDAILELAITENEQTLDRYPKAVS
jgi:hypothetical protein